MRACLNEGAGVAHRFLDGDVVREVGHVGDDECSRGSADDGLEVMQHVVHRDREGVGVAENDHTEGVADERDVGAGCVDRSRGWIVVRREHADALVALHLTDRGNGDSLLGNAHQTILLWTGRRRRGEAQDGRFARLPSAA